MTLSVIIPTKDRPEGLKRAVASALAAIPPEDASVLVIDDGCAVPARDVLAGIDDPRLQVMLNPGPHGPAAARNFGVRRCEAEVVFFLDDDDALLPGYVGRVLEAREGLATLPRFGFSAAVRDGHTKGKRLAAGPIPADARLDLRLAGLGMGFWIERQAFLDLGGIDEGLRVNEDTEFFLRLAANEVPGWYSPEAGVELNPGPPAPADEQPSITRSSDAAVRAQAFELMLARYGDFLSRHPRTRRAFIRRLAKYRARLSNCSGAISAAQAEDSPLWRAILRLEALLACLLARKR